MNAWEQQDRSSIGVMKPEESLHHALIELFSSRRAKEFGMQNMHVQSMKDSQLKAAVALNNTAATMLEHGALQGAMETFEDSVKLLKASVSPQNNLDAAMSMLEKNDNSIRFMIQKACHRSAQHLFSNKVENLLAGVEVLKISSQQDPSSVYSLLKQQQRCFPSSQTFYCMSIDSFDSEDISSATSDLNSSFLLYNFAIAHSIYAAHLCEKTLAQQDQKLGAISRHLLERSLRLLTLCEDGLKPRLQSSPLEYQSTPVLVLSMVMSLAIVRIASALEYESVAHHYENLFTSLTSAIDASQSILSTLNQAAAASA